MRFLVRGMCPWLMIPRIKNEMKSQEVVQRCRLTAEEDKVAREWGDESTYQFERNR